jgi:PAS domain S-box-containing protein
MNRAQNDTASSPFLPPLHTIGLGARAARLLFEPFVPMQGAEYSKAYTIAIVLFVTILAMLVVVLLERPLTMGGVLRLPVIIGVIAGYVLTRFGRYRTGANLTSIAVCLSPLLAIVIGLPDTTDAVALWRMIMLRSLVVSLVLTYMLYNLWCALAYAAGFSITVLILVLFASTPVNFLQIGLEITLSAIAFLLLLVAVKAFSDIERSQAQQDIAASEARYRAIVEDQTDLICRWKPDETTTFVNAAYARFLGEPPENLLNRSVMRYVAPDDLAFVRAQSAQLSLAKPTVTYESRAHMADGDTRWMQWTDRAIFDKEGRIIEYQSVGRDITDLKRVEGSEREQRMFAEALRANAALISSTLDMTEVLDRLLKHLSLAYPVVNANIMLMEGSAARVARSSGEYNPEYDLLLNTMIVHPEKLPNLRRMILTGLPVLVGDTSASPDWIPIYGSEWIRSSVGAPVRLEEETIGFLILNSDTPHAFEEKHALWLRAFADQAATAIRNARLYEEAQRHARDMETQVQARTKELELERSRLSTILDSTGEGIFYSEDEVIRFVNPTLCKMMDCAPDQLIGQHVNLLFIADSIDEARRMMNHYADVMREVGIYRGDVRMRRLSGSEFDAGVTLSPIGSMDETPSRVVTLVRDISHEKALEAQRSNLLSYASHELRTPLTNLKTRLYLMRRRPETMAAHLQVLDHVATRMQYIVESLLDMSRLERGTVHLECAPVDLVALVRQTTDVQYAEAENKQIVLRADLPATPLLIDADEQRMIQVLTNLVSNALNYTPAGGVVTVSAKRTGSVALLSVSDTGIGIAPEHLPHIFEPFYRVASKVDGTGLGLSIVKQIVELHKGEISVTSQFGVGSRFIVRLPLLDAV